MTNALLEFVSVSTAGLLGDLIGIVPMLNVAGAITVLAGIAALLVLARPAHQDSVAVP